MARKKHRKSKTILGFKAWHGTWTQENVVSYKIGDAKLPTLIVNFSSMTIFDSLTGHRFYLQWSPAKRGLVVCSEIGEEEGSSFLDVLHPITVDFFRYLEQMYGA